MPLILIRFPLFFLGQGLWNIDHMRRLKPFVLTGTVFFFSCYVNSIHTLFCFVLQLLAVDCGPLLDPTNGSSSGESTLFPKSVLFKCDSGFLLRGSSLRMCQPNGTWSGLQAKCVGRFGLNSKFPYHIDICLFAYT